MSGGAERFAEMTESELWVWVIGHGYCALRDAIRAEAREELASEIIGKRDREYPATPSGEETK